MTLPPSPSLLHLFFSFLFLFEKTNGDEVWMNPRAVGAQWNKYKDENNEHRLT